MISMHFKIHESEIYSLDDNDMKQLYFLPIALVQNLTIFSGLSMSIGVSSLNDFLWLDPKLKSD